MKRLGMKLSVVLVGMATLLTACGSAGGGGGGASQGASRALSQDGASPGNSNASPVINGVDPRYVDIHTGGACAQMPFVGHWRADLSIQATPHDEHLSFREDCTIVSDYCQISITTTYRGRNGQYWDLALDQVVSGDGNNRSCLTDTIADCLYNFYTANGKSYMSAKCQGFGGQHDYLFYQEN